MQEETERFVVECLKCGNNSFFTLPAARLREELGRLRRELLRGGIPFVDLTEEYLLNLLGGRLLQGHKCVPSEAVIVSRLLDEVRGGQRFGTPYTVRSLCREFAGKFEGYGRKKIEHLVIRQLEEGKLRLVEGFNANKVPVKWVEPGEEEGES
jgi:hypothetical protein